jgi:tetratricopeptide (TPR) repeat protein
MKTILLFLLFLSCAHQSQLVIKSQPQKANVSYFNPKSLSYEPLGLTPLTLDSDKSKFSEQELNSMTQIRVEKSGFVSESILIPSERMGSSEIILNLKSNHEWIDKDSASISKMAEDIARKLYNINRLTNANNYASALQEIDILLRNYPETSVFYDIKGSLHLLRKETELARQSFERSIQLRPDNIKTRQILEKLK